jgi:hypothetical protein
MPLHEWTDRPGWVGVRHLWITELLRWVKPRLPEGYRAYIGAAPTVAVDAPPEKPDVSVRRWEPPAAAPGPGVGWESPRVGEPAAEGGRLLAIWQRALTVGAPLPVMVLPLTVDTGVTVDLEQTYTRAAADAYLD